MSLPGWAAWALRRLTPPEIREELLGDVTEEWSYASGGSGVIVMPAVGNLTDDNGGGPGAGCSGKS